MKIKVISLLVSTGFFGALVACGAPGSTLDAGNSAGGGMVLGGGNTNGGGSVGGGNSSGGGSTSGGGTTTMPEYPIWAFADVQTSSPKFNQTYGLSEFAGRPLVVTLLEGF